MCTLRSTHLGRHQEVAAVPLVSLSCGRLEPGREGGQRQKIRDVREIASIGCHRRAAAAIPTAPGMCTRPLVEAQDGVVRPRHLPRHGDVAAADQPHIRYGVMGGTT
jgi:hypothetical protein